MLRWGKKYNWSCICWDFPTNLTFLGKGFRALRDLLCSLDDALAWPCYPTESGGTHREHTQPAVPDLKPLSHLHHLDIRACPIRNNNHLWPFLF